MLTKTKVMFKNIEKPVPEKIKLPDGNILDIIDDFKYLGAYIADSYSDFRRRKGIVWGKFWQLSKIWRATNIPLKLKLQLFDSLILSILFYAAETWTVSKKMEKEVNSFGTSCYRIMLNIKRTDRVYNTDILYRTLHEFVLLTLSKMSVL